MVANIEKASEFILRGLCTCLLVYTSWFQTTIIVSRDDVLDHDLVFPDHNVIN